MRSRIRPLPFARMRLNSALRELRAQPAAEWPKHFRLAREILVDELDVDDDTAQAILFDCLSVAHGCARAINQRSRDLAESALSLKLRNAFARIAKCVRRAPAPLRVVLDNDLCSIVHDQIINSESIEEVIDRLISAFARLPNHETSQTVLRSITPRGSLPRSDKTYIADLQRCFAEAPVYFNEDYSALHATDQRRVEAALTAVGRKRAAFGAADVCQAIAGVLDYNEGTGFTIVTADLITNYVAAAAEIWWHAGLRPTRSVRLSDLGYRSKFNRFVDLLLTGIVEPWSKRYDGNQCETAAKLYEAHARLPKDVRKSVRAAARRSDVEWLVGDDHVRKALARLKKPAPNLRKPLLSFSE